MENVRTGSAVIATAKRTGRKCIISLMNYIRRGQFSCYQQVSKVRGAPESLSSGRAGKSFITELIFRLQQFNSDTDLNSIALKAFVVLPSLILHKPSATSKSKELGY